jgi:hypothetical protein
MGHPQNLMARSWALRPTNSITNLLRNVRDRIALNGEGIVPISRPLKLTHTQTILYEIDMLRYTAGELSKGDWKVEKDKWICLEAFLVHFRNLIEFFGKPAVSKTDLHITKPGDFWRDGATRPNETELTKLTRTDLWDKYEDDQGDRISRFLHHCTTHRVDPKEWEVGIMYNELKSTLDAFEQLVPDKSRTWDTPVAVTITTMLNASTASGSSPTMFTTAAPASKPRS